MSYNIVYFTRTGNSRRIAKKIGEGLGTLPIEITDNKDWSGKIGYINAGRYAAFGKDVEIEVKGELQEGCDYIVVSPVWAGKVAPAIKMFIDKVGRERVVLVTSSISSKVSDIQGFADVFSIVEKEKNEDDVIETMTKSLFEIKEIEHYLELRPLFEEAGLEIHLDKDAPKGFLTAWKAENCKGEIIGGVSIENKEGNFVIGDIAIVETMRGKHIGARLLKIAEDRIRGLSGKEIYLVAKAPKFFEKYNFEYITREEAPDIFNCLNCEQFQVDCFPKLMRKKVK